MNFFNFKNKKFLDMSKAEMISHSIVIVDDTKIVPNKVSSISNNPFADLSSKITFINIMEKIDGERNQPIIEESPIERSFVFNDIVFKNSSLLPRVIVQQNSPELSDKLPKIFKEILRELPEIESKIAAVGINFEFFIEREDNGDVKAKIFQSSIMEGLESMTTTLVYNEADSKLNLTIADANYEGKKGIYFKANFHNKIVNDNGFQEILKKEKAFFDRANKRIEELLNVK